MVFTKAEISKVLASTACEQYKLSVILITFSCACVCTFCPCGARSHWSGAAGSCSPQIHSALSPTGQAESEPSEYERPGWCLCIRLPVGTWPANKHRHTVNYTSFGQILIFVNKLIQKMISAFCFHCKYKCSNVLTVWAAVFLVSRWADCWHEQQRPLNLWCLRTKTETVIYTALPAGHKTETAFISCI